MRKIESREGTARLIERVKESESEKGREQREE